MKILEVKVDKIPSSCQECLFFEETYNEDGWGGTWYHCELKVKMGYEHYGIFLRPCPLNPKVKEESRKHREEV